MNIRTQKHLAALAIAVTAISAAGAGIASADTSAPKAGAAPRGRGDIMSMHKRGVLGTVTVISGNTVTITSKQFAPHQKGTPPTATPAAPTIVTYTIDATSATVKKTGAASSVSNIAVGDMIIVEGTVNGTTITATTIEDGFGKGMGMKGEKDSAPLANLPTGNGQPIIGGSVTAITGNTITVTNTAGATYTVDATNAKFIKPEIASATIANISVGDSVIVQGAVNGTAVTAASVIDKGAKPAKSANGSTAQVPAKGFFGGIGGFFAHLFGF